MYYCVKDSLCCSDYHGGLFHHTKANIGRSRKMELDSDMDDGCRIFIRICDAIRCTIWYAIIAIIFCYRYFILYWYESGGEFEDSKRSLKLYGYPNEKC